MDSADRNIGPTPQPRPDLPPDPWPVAPAAGAVARWKILFERMKRTQPGEVVTYSEMGDLLGLDYQDLKERSLISAAAHKAAEELQKSHRLIFRVLRGNGFQHARPEQVIDLAHGHQRRAFAEITAGKSKINSLDLDGVDVTTAALVRATAMAFQRQYDMMETLDVRQQKLQKVVESLSSATEATAAIVDNHEDRIAQLQAQLDELKATQQPGPDP